MGFTNVKNLKRTTKVLVIGPTGVGKTFQGLQLERPIAVYDGEDGTRAFGEIFDFDVDPFDTIEELNRKIKEEFLGDPETCAKYYTVLVDGLTVAWHASLRELEDEDGTIKFSDQAKLKGPWKEFCDCVTLLGKRNKNVWVTVRAKAEWEIVRGQPPKLKGMKGDVEENIWYAFDVVGYLDVENGVRKFTVLKSRYPNAFQVGDVIEHFDLKTHFAPIFSGTGRYVEESSAVQDEMDRTRRLIEDKLRKLGSTARGGVIPAEDARRIYNIAKTSRSPEELAQALADVRQYEDVKAPAVA